MCTDIMLFRNPPYMASRQLLIPRIPAVGTLFSPLSCQAWPHDMIFSMRPTICVLIYATKRLKHLEKAHPTVTKDSKKIRSTTKVLLTLKI
jgi:predicted solute-binding protein